MNILDIKSPGTELEKELSILCRYITFYGAYGFKLDEFPCGYYLTASNNGEIAIHPKGNKRYKVPKLRQGIWFNNWNTGKSIGKIPEDIKYNYRTCIWEV